MPVSAFTRSQTNNMKPEEFTTWKEFEASLDDEFIETLPERYKVAIKGRMNGETYQSLGQVLQVSGGRAREIHHKALRDALLRKRGHKIVDLSIGSQNLITNFFGRDFISNRGFDEAKLIEAIRNGKFQPSQVRNLGKKKFQEICSFVGIDHTKEVMDISLSISTRDKHSLEWLIKKLESRKNSRHEKTTSALLESIQKAKELRNLLTDLTNEKIEQNKKEI